MIINYYSFQFIFFLIQLQFNYSFGSVVFNLYKTLKSARKEEEKIKKRMQRARGEGKSSLASPTPRLPALRFILNIIIFGWRLNNNIIISCLCIILFYFFPFSFYINIISSLIYSGRAGGIFNSSKKRK